MLRIALPTLLLALVPALPALAQEPEEKPGFEERVSELARKIEKADAEERAKLLAELTRLIRQSDLPRMNIPTPRMERRGTRIVFGGWPFRETMSGSWADDGKKGTYTLKSLGEGKYRLTAQVTEKGGTRSKIADEGSLRDLQQRHAFLHVHVLVGMPDRAGGTTTATARARPIVGLRVSSASEALRHHLILPQGAGLIIDEVAPGTRAERLGLKRYDILVKLDDEVLDTPTQLAALARGRGKLEYVRRGKTRTLDLSRFTEEPAQRDK